MQHAVGLIIQPSAVDVAVARLDVLAVEKAEHGGQIPLLLSHVALAQPDILPDQLLTGIALDPLTVISVFAHKLSALVIQRHDSRQILQCRLTYLHCLSPSCCFGQCTIFPVKWEVPFS